VSRRKLVAALNNLFGVELSVGAVQAICEEVSEVAAPAVSEVHAEVEQSPAVNADETGWRQRGQMHWLWTAATPDAAFFVLAPDRGHAALEQLFPQAPGGILMSDRWVAYKRFDVEKRQLCHGHLRPRLSSGDRPGWPCAVDRPAASRRERPDVVDASRSNSQMPSSAARWTGLHCRRP